MIFLMTILLAHASLPAGFHFRCVDLTPMVGAPTSMGGEPFCGEGQEVTESAGSAQSYYISIFLLSMISQDFR